MTGTIHFDTRETATFTSASGGHLPLTREALGPGQFHSAVCGIS